LRAYPTSFRSERGEDYFEVIAHRWLRERRRGGLLVAAVRTVRVLLADTSRAAPAAHRLARREWRRLARKGNGRAWAGFGGALMDARVALRSLAKRPGFTTLVVLTLGLGIGANAALFGALDRIVLRPLPYPDGDRLVYVMDRHRELGWQITPGEQAVARWRESAQTVEWLETWSRLTAVRTGAGVAELLEVTTVSVGLPESLGVQAVAGRVPRASDIRPSDPPVVMLAEGFWKREFGADAGVIGRTMRLNDTIFTVAGVWPAAARLELGRTPDLWRIHAADVFGEGYFVMALARQGATAGDIESELAALSGGLEDGRQGFVPVVHAPYWMLGDTYVQGLWLVFGGVVLLLLVALANTANLLLNRTVSRAGELGVRAAVGGSAGALARLFLMESLALTGVGVAVAILVARVGGGALAALVPERLPVLEGASADARVLGYAALLAAVSAFICVLAPVTHLRSLDVRRLLSRAEVGRSGGGRSGWTRQALVALQVGLAVVLVTGSALTLRSFQKLTSVDAGVAVDRLAQFSVRLPEPRYATPEARSAFWDRLLEAVESLPGVEGVTTTSASLMRYYLDARPPHLEGEPKREQPGAVSYGAGVRPGFFSVTGVPLLEGRDFDRSDERVIIVNRTFARRHSESVIGRRITFDDSTFYGIIGVAGDVMAGGLRENPDRLQFYRPDLRLDGSFERFIVRAAGDPAAVLSVVRARLAELDPDLPIREVTTGAEILRNDTARHRFVAQLLAVFGSLALLLAVTGVYGVVALDVSRRTREVGIRVALGAGMRRVVGDVLNAGLRPVVIGIIAGALASLWAVRYVEGMLYRVPTTDPLSIATGIGLLLLAATAACAIPARRASRVDPVRALRAE
jgi:predicted permease